MTIPEIIEYFKKRPYAIKQGSGLLSRRLHCSRADVIEARNILYKEGFEKKFPKVLIFDIETSPMKAYVWKRWKENISLEQTISEWFMIAWSAKWLYGKTVMGEVLTPEEALNEDDSRIVKSLWELINQADVVVAHNGNAFDIPKMNSRFIIHGLPPTKPYFSVDTYRVAKRQFGFSSNKLDALAGYFGLAGKLDTDFDLWKRCLEGDAEALGYMLEYNKMDVKVLEEVYLKLLPWIKGHPNMNAFTDEEVVCTNCGSTEVELLEGEYYYTQVNKYQLLRCKHCGAIFRSRGSIGTNTLVMNNLR